MPYSVTIGTYPDDLFNKLLAEEQDQPDLFPLNLDESTHPHTFQHALKRGIDIAVEEFDQLNQQQWFMPEDYCPNLVEWLFEQCSNDEQANRVSEELELFIQYKMMDVLRYVKYAC